MASDSTAALYARTLATGSTRYARRHDKPVWPFVWRGLLPLLGLLLLLGYALVPFARYSIETPVRVQTRAALDRAGLGWVNLTVSGQQVSLSGVQPKPGAGDQALAVAQGVACPTWLGPSSCVVSVVGQFTDAAPAPIAAPAAPAAAASAAASAAQTAAAAKTCEAEFAALLSDKQIRFAIAKADIQPESRPLIDKLAQAASTCPGEIHIEGYTDSNGDAAMNQALSQARADAVRDALIARGLTAERLVAQGFGAQKPIATNDTPAGRAANRRIELRATTDR
jgi:outer membrane protein OmpA-like peptidoglycan-associated protein